MNFKNNKRSINQKITDKANSLGFQKVGFAQAQFYDQDKNDLYSWIDEGYHGQMQWLENRKEERANILKYFPDAKTVISFGFNYFTGRGSRDISEEYKFSNYAWGDDYHIVIKEYLYEIINYMKTIMNDFNYRVCVDTSPLMEKKWAVRSGIGWIGKHSNVITKDYGSWIFLSEIIIDKEIDYSAPFIEDLCGSCTACIDECPTNAIVEPYILDSNKCISYLTIEHRGEIPGDYKNKLDNWMYGCDVCQEVCPWNIKFEKETQELRFSARKDIKNKNKIDDWEINQNEFSQIFKKSAVKRTKYSGLKRNISLLK